LENTTIQGVETNIQFLIAVISDQSFVGDQLSHVTVKSLEEKMDTFIEATVQLDNKQQNLIQQNSKSLEAAPVAATTSALQFKPGDAFNIEISDPSTNDTNAIHSFQIDSISTNNFPDQFVGQIQTSIPTIKNPLAISFTRKSAVGSSSTLRRKANPRAPREIGTPVTGMVVEINVKEGDLVEARQQLFVMSAMKMETVVQSSVAGVVKTVYASANDLIEVGDVVIELSSNNSKL
jgi:pyruvate carboxylase